MVRILSRDRAGSSAEDPKVSSLVMYISCTLLTTSPPLGSNIYNKAIEIPMEVALLVCLP